MDGPVALLIDNPSTGTRTVVVHQNWQIEKLYDKVADLMNATDFELIAQGSVLDKQKFVRDYHFSHNESVTFVMSVHGGSRLRPLPGLIELTDEPCELTYDDNKHEKRARMPCGCVLAAKAVEQHANQTLEDGENSFACPNCEAEWDFYLVFHVLSATMTPEQINAKKKLADVNFMQKPEQDIRQCGMCKSYVRRDFTKKWYPGYYNRAVCAVCTKRRGSTVEFCWLCLQEWKGNRTCGNSSCEKVIADRLKTLASCKTKQIGGVTGCPDTRACPTCGTLIQHIDACKHVRCRCGCEFCFVCMKPQDSQGQWQCGSYSSMCPVADRQRSIPS